MRHKRTHYYLTIEQLRERLGLPEEVEIVRIHHEDDNDFYIHLYCIEAGVKEDPPGIYSEVQELPSRV